MRTCTQPDCHKLAAFSLKHREGNQHLWCVGCLDKIKSVDPIQLNAERNVCCPVCGEGIIPRTLQRKLKILDPDDRELVQKKALFIMHLLVKATRTAVDPSEQKLISGLDAFINCKYNEVTKYLKN